MIYSLSESDYSLGAHPKVMEALMATNMEHTDGYALDRFSLDTADMIRELIGKSDARVQLSRRRNTHQHHSHSCCFETIRGGYFGRFRTYIRSRDGVRGGDRSPRLCSSYRRRQTSAQKMWKKYCFITKMDIPTIPKLVYITHPTENGGVYTKAELTALRDCCDKHGLYLYMDGARLWYGPRIGQATICL